MPTNKKRIGFIPREDVIKIIDKLSVENNLSNSKIISILVEEALAIRGLFNKKTGKEKQSYREQTQSSEYLLGDMNDSNYKKKSTVNSKSEKSNDLFQTNFIDEIKPYDLDLQTFKKFLSFLEFQEMMDKYSN